MEDKLMRISTPTVTYYIDDEDFDISTVAKATMYIQNVGGTNRLAIENPYVDAEEKSFSVDLTQEQTKSLSTGTVEVEVHIKLTDGNVIWTDIAKTTMERVIGEDIL